MSRDSTRPFWLARGSHRDHVGSSSQALAPLDARVVEAPRQLAETEIRGRRERPREMQGDNEKPEEGSVIYVAVRKRTALSILM